MTDKSTWGDGPWQDEPDEDTWIDEATGLTCHIARPEMGHLCGYVAIPEDHPWSHRGYDEAPISDVDVHGGLTFAGQISRTDDRWWFGFDCAHGDDVMPGIGRAYTDAMIKRGATYKDIAFVRAECADLARQLSEAKP